MADMMNDATAYGGRMSGFDPAYSDQVGSEAIYTPAVDEFDLNSMYDYSSPEQFSEYGSGGSSSSGVYGEASHPNTSNFQQGLSTVNDFFSKNAFGKLAGMALNFTPVGKAFNVARGAATMLGGGNPLGAASTIAGAYGGLPGAMMNAGYNASKGNFGSAGGLAGGLAGGPAGAFVGNQIGQAVSGRGAPGVSGVQQGREAGGPDWAGIIGGLGGLYGNRGGGNISGADANNQAVSQQIQSLGNMYSPNSPYAQQLRQTLERKDAASGRRSQYGPREVQLMAALADKQASVSDSMGRLAQTNQANQIALQDRKRLQRGQNLATLGGLAKQSGLLDMFRGGGGGGNTQQAAPVDYGPPAQYDVPDTSYWDNP